uniref:Putative secreted peptide n=1 Tax=Anopheles braziliensis TaxID=58242 RepID=A0A2M3ZTD0_9DIPT
MPNFHLWFLVNLAQFVQSNFLMFPLLGSTDSCASDLHAYRTHQIVPCSAVYVRFLLLPIVLPPVANVCSDGTYS